MEQNIHNVFLASKLIIFSYYFIYFMVMDTTWLVALCSHLEPTYELLHSLISHNSTNWVRTINNIKCQAILVFLDNTPSSEESVVGILNQSTQAWRKILRSYISFYKQMISHAWLDTLSLSHFIHFTLSIILIKKYLF